MKHKLINLGIYIIANVSGFIIALLPDRAFYFCVKCLANIFKKLDKRRKFDCLANLNFIYGEKLEEKERILERCYQNFAFVLLNALRLRFISKEKYLKRFIVHNKEIIESTIERGNFIVVTAHYGDWEATARWIASNYPQIHLSVIGRLTQFEAINNLMEHSRQIFGSSFLDKKGASKHLIKLLNKPNQAIGIVIDQNISPNEGIFVNFFGKQATHTTIASVLARKYNIPIIFVWTTLERDYSTYHIYFDFVTNAIITQDSKNDILEMTQMQADYTQKIIKDKPDEWFWFHKRFKATHSEIYRPKGKK